MTTEPVAPVTEWIRDYTAFMRCDAGDRWLSEVESQVAAWLREKHLDADLHRDADLESDGVKLSVRRAPEGGSHDLRVQLVENAGATGVWSTELVAHDETGDRDWIHLSVTNDQGRFVDVPRLAKYLMQVLPLADGSIEFVDRPQMFGVSDLDRLTNLLSDRERHGLVFVAGSADVDNIPLSPYVDKVSVWTRQVFGLAQIVVLDPAATQEFELRVGRFHTPAWTIRTYLPGVEFGNVMDSGRHRILGTERLARQSDGSIRLLLGDIARKQAADRELPGAVRRVRRRFERLENRRLVEGLASAVGETEPDGGAPATVLKEPIAEPRPRPTRSAAETLGLVQRILDLKEVTEESLRELALRLTRIPVERVRRFEQRIDTLQAKVEELEDRNTALDETLAEEQMAHQIALLDIDDREGRIRWLESQLKARDDYASLYAETPPEFVVSRPASFDELLERVEALESVTFTGNPSDVARLAAIDSNDAALRTAWDVVQTLNDYVSARATGECVGGLDQYIKNPPSPEYHTISRGKWASTETSATMNSYGSERSFPVPECVDPSGRVEMKAHFKLARIGMSSPRMYIYDGHPGIACVFIGYIGPHLTNTQTN